MPLLPTAAAVHTMQKPTLAGFSAPLFVFMAVSVIIGSMYIYFKGERFSRWLEVVSRRPQQTVSLVSLPYAYHGFPKEKIYTKTPWDRRNCSIGENTCRQVVLMGAGYSGTGFFSKVFTKIGCNIGHECMDTYGVSDWRRSFEPIDGRIFFTHKFVQVRHPLKHVRSWRGVKWNFAIPSYYDCRKKSKLTQKTKALTENPSTQERRHGPMIHFKDFTMLNNATIWKLLPGEIQMLDYWTVGNIRALASANMWWKLENVDEKLLNDICTIIPCPLCNVTEIRQAIGTNVQFNSHKKEGFLPDWDELCSQGRSTSIEVTEAIQTICHRARELCSTLQYENC